MGKSVDLSSLLKKVFLIDFYNKMKKKREDKLDEEEYDEEEEDDDEYEYEDVYVTPIEKIDSKEIK